METALLRWYTLTENKQEKRSLIFTILVYLTGLNLVLILAGYIFSESLSIIIFDNPAFRNIIVLTFLIACFEALMVIPLSLLRAENKPVKYLLITITSTVIALLMQLYFLIYTNNKLEGIFISKFAAPCITFIILLPFLLKRLNFNFSFAHLKELIAFSFPLMLTGVVSMLLNSVNRFILGFIGKPDDVGLFSLASNISGILTFVLISPFQLAFNAIFWQKLKDSNAARFFTKSVTYSFLLYVWGAIVISLLIPYIIKIYIPTKPEYWESQKLVSILSMSLVFYGMLTISYMSYHHAKRNDLIFYFQCGALLLNILLNYLLIPLIGMYGAAISTFVSFFILIVSMYIFSKKFYFIKYETLKLSIIFILAGIIIFVFQYFNIQPKWLDISLRIITSIVFPLLLLPLNIYESIEIETAKKIIRKYLKINV